MGSGGSLIISPDAPPLVRSRWAGYVELTRPRLAVMVLFTVAAGFGLASAGAPDLARLLHTVFGTALVVAGATALNQVLERHSDAQMDRTRNRPLPSGRLQPVEVLIFGVIMALAGLAYLALTVRQSLAILSAGFALTSYVFLYTPPRRKTTLNTLVGAVPGAMPPVIGWTAVAADAEGVPGLLADPTGVDACGGSVEIMARTTVKLAPSILAADFARRGEQGADAGEATKDRIHIGQRS